jgi:hypothetical protein
MVQTLTKSRHNITTMEHHVTYRAHVDIHNQWLYYPIFMMHNGVRNNNYGMFSHLLQVYLSSIPYVRMFFNAFSPP